jgi:hypothetical protein
MTPNPNGHTAAFCCWSQEKLPETPAEPQIDSPCFLSAHPIESIAEQVR